MKKNNKPWKILEILSFKCDSGNTYSSETGIIHILNQVQENVSVELGGFRNRKDQSQ